MSTRYTNHLGRSFPRKARAASSIVPAVLFAVAALAQACSQPAVDDTRTDQRLFPVAGVISGTVSYTGPHPCSRGGHIVGAAVIIAFDRRNPPPPGGLGAAAINFVAVPGDTLFANEPRNPAAGTYCPQALGNTETITASASYTMAPMVAGSYVIQAFYDYTGTFFPTFKIRDLPEAGDIAGGYIDLADAAKHQGDINYLPIFLPVDVGNPLPVSAMDPDAIPEFVLPNEGFVRGNIPVTIGSVLPLPRPYFYVKNPGHGMDPNNPDPVNHSDFVDSSDVPAASMPHFGSADTNDVNFAPVLTMSQDWQVDAQPSEPTEGGADQQQATFPTIVLQAGVPAAELPSAIAIPDYTKAPPYPPFQWQLPGMVASESLFVWASGNGIPEDPMTVDQMYPVVVFSKLLDDPSVNLDPEEVVSQGSGIAPVAPAVVIQGLTLFHDSLFSTTVLSGGIPKSPSDPAAATDHVTVMIRPSVICFNPNAFDQGGLLVTPHETGTDPATNNQAPILQPTADDVIANANASALPSRRLINTYRYACLPTGRYAVNAVYPSGQAWTTPNEAGSCAQLEGTTNFLNPIPTGCSAKPRPVLYSQGHRAVIEITPAKDPTFCGSQTNTDGTSNAVPVECLPCKSGQPWGIFGTCP